MTRGKAIYYVVYDAATGEVEFDGCMKDLTLYFNTNHRTLYHHAVSGQQYKGKIIKPAHRVDAYESKKEIAKGKGNAIKYVPKNSIEPDHFTDDYDYLSYHLKMYGNTVFPTNPKKSLLNKLLKKDGIKVKITYFPPVIIEANADAMDVHPYTREGMYILERIKEDD